MTEKVKQEPELSEKETINQDIKKQDTPKGKPKEKVNLEDKDHAPVEDWEQYLDMDIRTGLSPESKKISENIFLTRGLNNIPEPEKVNCRQYNYNSCKLPSYDWISKLDISLMSSE